MTEFLPTHPTQYVIARSKIVDYLLNPNHTRGGSKAKFFMSFGFSSDRPEELADALAAQRSLPRGEGPPDLVPGESKIIIEGPISAPDGRSPHVRTVWQVMEDGTARFVTAVPITR